MAAADTKLMIDKICRSCMCEKAEMQDVFKKTLGEDEDALLLCDALMACAAVEIISGDGLPYLLCDVCETKLCSAYEFKQQCEKSDMTLREITNQTGSKSSKEEDIVVQPDVHEELFDEEDEDDLPLSKRKCSLSNELTCSYCLKIFSSRRGLRVHLRQHTGDGLRYCPLCPSKYTRTNHLLRHMKIHDKPGRKHSCKLCAQKYTQSGNLFRHMKSHIEEVERKARREVEGSELVEVKRENEDEAIKAEKVIERVNNAADFADKEIEQQLADNNEIKVNQDEIIDASIAAVIKSTNDEDSMDIPLSQFSFSDYEEDDVENLAEVSTEKEDTKDEDFEVKEKKPRGRPPKKDNTLYKCKECDKILTTYTGLKVHLRRHTGADLARCKTMESDDDVPLTPPDVRKAARNVEINLLPEKSKKIYEDTYCRFMDYRKNKNIGSFSENVLIAYFAELSQKLKSSTLWSVYSMLKSTLSIHHNVDLAKYLKLRAFLKRQKDLYQPKKSKVFEKEEVIKFLSEAPDANYLSTKVAAVLAIAGACRSDELVRMQLDDIEDMGNKLLVSLPDTKTKRPRSFVVSEHLDIYRKYASYRPSGFESRRFFFRYWRGKALKQVIGIHKFGAMPQEIATYLKLPNAQKYTGHCFRRTSATWLVNSGVTSQC